MATAERPVTTATQTLEHDDACRLQIDKNANEHKPPEGTSPSPDKQKSCKRAEEPNMRTLIGGKAENDAAPEQLRIERIVEACQHLQDPKDPE